MADKKKPIMIYFSPKEKARIKKKAEELGLNNMSAYVRMLVHRDLRDVPEKRVA